MITVFNRRELLTSLSMEKYFAVRQALDAAGIANTSKNIAERRSWMSGRGRGREFRALDQSAACMYTVYVHRSDYDLAVRAIQPVLQKW